MIAPGADAIHMDFYITCHTHSNVGRVQLSDITGYQEKAIYPTAKDTTMELLTFEHIRCELEESLTNGTLMQSHGECDYPYRHFLKRADNSVTCLLKDGSRFKLQMRCLNDCPEPIPPHSMAYCNGTTDMPDASFGMETSFGDGSPGFALYSPNTSCVWRIPKPTEGVTNFIFTRFDLAAGDVVTIYESIDGGMGHKIKVYNETTAAESVASPAPFMLIEFTSDAEKEGLGFSGYYYETEGHVLPNNGGASSQVTNDPHAANPVQAESNHFYHESGNHLVEPEFVPVVG